MNAILFNSFLHSIKKILPSKDPLYGLHLAERRVDGRIVSE